MLQRTRCTSLRGNVGHIRKSISRLYQPCEVEHGFGYLGLESNRKQEFTVDFSCPCTCCSFVWLFQLLGLSLARAHQFLDLKQIENYDCRYG